MNGVRPLPSVNPQVVPLPPVDESFYQVRPLPPVIESDAIRPLPPVDGGVRLAYGDMGSGGGVRLAGGAMSGAMPDYSTEGGFTPPPITFPNTMDEYADQSRNKALEPGRLDAGMDEYANQSKDAQNQLKRQTTALVDQLGKGVTLDYERAYNQYQHPEGADGVRGLGRRMRQAVAQPVTRVGSLAKMLRDPEKLRKFSDALDGRQPPTLAVNDIEKMAQRDYVENYYPRRRG